MLAFFRAMLASQRMVIVYFFIRTPLSGPRISLLSFNRCTTVNGSFIHVEMDLIPSLVSICKVVVFRTIEGNPAYDPKIGRVDGEVLVRDALILVLFWIVLNIYRINGSIRLVHEDSDAIRNHIEDLHVSGLGTEAKRVCAVIREPRPPPEGQDVIIETLS